MKPSKQTILLKLFASGKYFCTKNGCVWSRSDRHGGLGPRRKLRFAVGGTRPYLRVVLVHKGKPYTFLAHHAIWVFFKGKIPIGLEINHKNKRVQDIRLRNLELVTKSNNELHKNGSHYGAIIS